MKAALLLTALSASSLSIALGQVKGRFISRSYDNFFEWYHQQSQVSQLYANHSDLYIFGHLAPVHAAPSRKSKIIARLNIGQRVRNIAYPEDYLPNDRIDGYSDIWYHISGEDPGGNAFRGYIWGNAIARGWRQGDITGDGQPEFVMLGLCGQPRAAPEDIKAEIRVLQNGRLIEQHIIPGLCLSEECSTSPMLRILSDQHDPRLVVIETSTVAIGCSGGIEKAFSFWNGRRLEQVFHAEYTTQEAFLQKEFSVPIIETATGTTTAVKVCRYEREDEQYNPVWDCRTAPVPEAPAEPRQQAAVQGAGVKAR